jgi:hypothetical protein
MGASGGEGIQSIRCSSGVMAQAPASRMFRRSGGELSPHPSMEMVNEVFAPFCLVLPVY